jgi:hypothetical protein
MEPSGCRDDGRVVIRDKPLLDMQFLVFLLLILFLPAVFYAGWVVGFLFLQYGLGEPVEVITESPQVIVSALGFALIFFTGSLIGGLWKVAEAFV